MYNHPDNLIKSFIKSCDSQIAQIVHEMHMTEFFTRDRQELVKLVKVLEKSCLYILELANYRIGKNNRYEADAFLEYDELKAIVHNKILNNEVDLELINTLQDAKNKLKGNNGGKNNV